MKFITPAAYRVPELTETLNRLWEDLSEEGEDMRRRIYRRFIGDRVTAAQAPGVTIVRVPTEDRALLVLDQTYDDAAVEEIVSTAMVDGEGTLEIAEGYDISVARLEELSAYFQRYAMALMDHLRAQGGPIEMTMVRLTQEFQELMLVLNSQLPTNIAIYFTSENFSPAVVGLWNFDEPGSLEEVTTVVNEALSATEEILEGRVPLHWR